MTTSSLRVVLAEDDILLADLYKTRLELCGITVLHCKDGQEVIDQLKEIS
jgi:CheY-like chemotaxis protein